MLREYGEEFLRAYGRVMRPKPDRIEEIQATRDSYLQGMNTFMERTRLEREQERERVLDEQAHAFVGSAVEIARNGSSERVNHPSHYQSDFGVECIDVVEHFNFNRGNALKYIWRAGAKGDEIEDLRKAAWYVNREIERLERGKQ